MTKTYKVTYLVTMDKDVDYPVTVATFWVRKMAQNTELELPDFVHYVTKSPSVEEVITEAPKPVAQTNKPKPKGK
jgi:cytidylate kinase